GGNLVSLFSGWIANAGSARPQLPRAAPPLSAYPGLMVFRPFGAWFRIPDIVAVRQATIQFRSNRG
ncbi:hypothetical protein, partial [Cyclobacterium salsum]|uniref:hypothetical protein n=1 Tax=Cyclobacterium salsum TaxID=2666329 RepID=UPI001F2B00F3